MGYPVAYRAAARTKPGYQRLRPTPANANNRLYLQPKPRGRIERTPPKAIPFGQRDASSVLRDAARSKPARLARRAVRAAGRVVRPLQLVDLAIDVATGVMVKPTNSLPDTWEVPSGWQLRCWGNGSADFSNNVGYPQSSGLVNLTSPTSPSPYNGGSTLGWWQSATRPQWNRHAATFQRVAGQPVNPLPYQKPRWIPEVVPTPVYIPYRNLPARKVDPWRVDQREVGNHPKGHINLRPVRTPSIGTHPVPKAHAHRRAPPPPGVKERKGTVVGMPRGKLNDAISLATETVDLIDVFHDALPKRYQAKPDMVRYGRPTASPQAKLMALYRNAGKINLPAAIVGLMYETAEDRVYGYLGKRAAKAARDLGRPHGLQFGPAL